MLNYYNIACYLYKKGISLIYVFMILSFTVILERNAHKR